MNKIQRLFYRLHMFYLWPAFWKEARQYRSVRKAWTFWRIEEGN